MQTTNPDPKNMTDAEFSAWLAEHLMGWKFCAPDDCWETGQKSKWRASEGVPIFVPRLKWSPPTNVQQAMEDVVWTMCDKGYACTLYPSLLRASFGSWDMQRIGQTQAASREQYPRAICEAAYLALVERGDE